MRRRIVWGGTNPGYRRLRHLRGHCRWELDQFDRPDVRGKRVLILRGDGGREHLGDSLRARGAHVDAIACYRRAQPRSGVRGLVEAFHDGAIDVVTITSSEALDNLWTIADDSLRAAWRARPTFAPHPRIVAHARDMGLTAIATAGGDAGLIAGLLEWIAAHPREAS